ncbi:unnamed protein product [Ectocarpus fasciculatus]
MRKMGRTAAPIKTWTPRSAQGLVMTMMVLVQNSLTIPAALGEKRPVIEPRDGRGDETATAGKTTATGRDVPRQNWLRHEELSFSRGGRRRNQQLRAKQERTPHAPVSSGKPHNQQEWEQEPRQLEGTTRGTPELSVGIDIPEDGDSALAQIYRASTAHPTNGVCPVAIHNSNSVLLKSDRDDTAASTAIVGASAVWDRLRQASTASSRLRCPSPPCCLGVHEHTYGGGDLGEEMSHIQGAVVVRRPDLVQDPGSLAPAHDLDFVKTFQSYFPIAQSSLLRFVVSLLLSVVALLLRASNLLYCRSSLLPGNTTHPDPLTRGFVVTCWNRRLVEADGFNLTSTHHHVFPTFKSLLVATSFLGAVREGNPTAAQLLTPYCSGEDPRQHIEECVRIPTLVSMANVYSNKKGALWNDNDFIMPVNCQGPRRNEVDIARQAALNGLPRSLPQYDKVFVMAQEWSPNYYHFTVEHLPRITLALDILLENPEIMISMHYYQHDPLHHDISAVREVQMEMLEILGINRNRIVFAREEMHANLAIVPTTSNCGDPDLHMVNMLRNRFLQGLFPTTNGVPPAPPRPVIVLVVRSKLRGLTNNEQVKEALKRNFPSFKVVEFFGTGSLRDQLETFATAAMIIAPHGAGLANMIVAPLHTPVLEIGTLACPPCFLRLALKLHHIYARHPGGDWPLECHTWYEPGVDEIVELARDLLEAKRLADDALELPEVVEAHREHA